jgi:general secretion pathway protein A
LPDFSSKRDLPDSGHVSDTSFEEFDNRPVPVPEPEAGTVVLPIGEAVGGVREPAPIASGPVAVAASLDENWLDNQHAQAWKAMAALWQDQKSAREIQSACDGMQGMAYACLRDHGSLARVQQLGLPVLLVLQDEEMKYLLLRGMTPDGLLVGDQEASIEISRKAIEKLWLGEFIVPWPQAPNWPTQIKRGQSGVAVDIVMEMATFAKPPWRGNAAFDESFESWLMTFQRRHGLRADGIVGPNTLLYLMAPTISRPRLIITSGP